MKFVCALVALALIAGPATAYHLGDKDEMHCWGGDGKLTDCPEGVNMIFKNGDDAVGTISEGNPQTVVVGVPVPFKVANEFTDAFLAAYNLTEKAAAKDAAAPLIPHANFHICKDVIGFCTPFINAACGAPGTFTSTPAIKGFTGPMEQDIVLPNAGTWIAIWHIKVGPHSMAVARFITAIDSDRCEIGWREVLDPLTGQTDCQACPAGTRGTEDRQCEPCEVGYYSPEASVIEGTGFAGAGAVYRAAICIECDTLGPTRYTDEVGASVCKTCPENTQRSIGSPGFVINECLCKPGFWQTEGQDNGAACTPCQEPGGVCLGGLSSGKNLAPYNADGWWGQKEATTGIFIECFTGPEWCHENYVCDSKHQGRMCVACADNYFSIGGFCIECYDSDAKNYTVTLILIIIVVSLWVLLNTRAVEKYFSLDIVLAFLQIYQLIGYFSIRWPAELGAWHAITNFALFNIDFVQPQCIGDWNKTTEFALQLLLNPIVGVVCTMMYLFNKFHATTIYPWYRQSLGWKKSLFRLPVTKKQLVNNFDVLVGFFCAFLVETYTALCLKAFESFMCEELPDGSGDLLLAWPDITCWESRHYGHVVGSVLAIIVYVIGIPLATYLILKKGADQSIMADKKFFTRYGFMYARYHLDFWYWEMTMYLRKAVIAFLTVFVRSDGVSQCALAIVVLVLCLASQAFQQPYRSKSLFYLDCLGLLTSILYALSGILFTTYFEHTDVAQVAVFIPVVTTIIWAYFQFRDEYIEKASSVKALRALGERIPQVLINNPHAVDASFALMCENIRKAFDEYDVDKTGELTKEQLTQLMTKFTDLSPVEIEGIFNRCDSGKTGSLEREEFETLVFVELLHLVRTKTQRESFVAGRMNVHNSFTKWTNLAADGTDTNVKTSAKPEAVPDIDVPADSSMQISAAFRRASVGYEDVHGEVAPARNNNLMQEAADAKRAGFAKKMAESKMFQAVNNMMTRRDNNAFYGELATTVLSRRLWDWILTQKDEMAIVRFYKLDKVLTPHLTDHSMHSAYSNNPLALFHHDLLQSFPFVLDYLVEAEDEDIAKFRDLVEKLVRYQYRVKGKRSDGRIAKMIHALDHSALSIWLHSFSEASERRELQSLLEDVYEHTNEVNDNVRFVKTMCGMS